MDVNNGDDQIAKEEPKPKRKVGMVSVRTILKNPRRYGFVDNDCAHRYTQGMSRDALVRISTISDADKGLVSANLPGADGASTFENRERIDLQGSISKKAAEKQPVKSSSSAHPASIQEHSNSSCHTRNLSGLRDEVTQPQRKTTPPMLSVLSQSQPIASISPSLPERDGAKPSQKKRSWRDPPTAADDPDDPLSKFYATGTYTVNSRAAYRKNYNPQAPRGQPDVMDLGSRILAKMSLVPQTKVFPQQVAVQPIPAVPNQPTTAVFGQSAIGYHHPPPHPISSGTAPSTITASLAASAPSQPSTAPSGQLSLPPFHPPSNIAASSASFANGQANSGTHPPQGQADTGHSTNIQSSTQPAPNHHTMPPGLPGTVPSTSVVGKSPLLGGPGPQPTSSSGQINPSQASTITWLSPVSPATFAASRGGMLPPIRPSTLAASHATAHTSADLSHPLPASLSGRIGTTPPSNASTNSDRPRLTSSSSRTVMAVPTVNASTYSGSPPPSLPVSNYERMAMGVATSASINSGHHLPASSSSNLAATPAHECFDYSAFRIQASITGSAV